MEDHHLHKRSKKVLLTAVVLLLGGVGALLWMSTRAPYREIRLPDGRVVRLWAVTYGKEERILGSPVQLLAHRILPPRMREWARVRTINGTGTRSLRFWGDERQPLYLRRLTPSSRVYAVPIDEHGCAAAGGFDFGWGDWSFSTFPRRGRQVGLRLFADSGPPRGDWSTSEQPHLQPLGEVFFPAPATIEPPASWSPAPLPQSVAAQDLRVTLEKLVISNGRAELMRMGPPAWDAGCAEAHLRIEERGRLAPWWQAQLQEVEDPSGNVWNSFSASVDGTPGRTVTHFQPFPCRDEPQWQLRFRLTRRKEAHFVPSELFVFHDIPLLPPGSRKPLTQEMEFSGVRLSALEALGPNTPATRRLFNTQSDFKASRAAVVLQFRGLDLPLYERTLVRAVDDRGRPVRLEHRFGTMADTLDVRLLEFNAQPGARSVTVTYAMHRPVEVKIRADSPQPRSTARQ